MRIQVTPIPFLPEQVLRLQRWLSQPEAGLLFELLQSKSAQAEAQAIKELLDDPKFPSGAAATMEQADTWGRFLQFLQLAQSGGTDDKPFRYERVTLTLNPS